MATIVVRRSLLALCAALLASCTAAHADHQYADVSAPQTVSPDVPVDIQAAIAPWNRIAGRTLLTVSDDDPDVMFVVGGTASWVQRDDGRCRIHLAEPVRLATVQHELGHCLGFADHTWTDDPHGRQGLKTCGVPDDVHYSPYSGVMSYCDFATQHDWWGPADVAMVARANFGFRPPAPWAAPSWRRAEAAGVVIDASDPWDTLTKQELIVFLDRAGLLDQETP